MPVASRRQSNPSPSPRLSRTGKPLFFPMDDSLMLALMRVTLTDAERRVWEVIRYHLTTYGPPLVDAQPISLTTFCKLTGLPRRTVIRALEGLEQKGMIQVSG